MILCRLEIIKTIKEDKVLINQNKSKNAQKAKEFTEELSELLASETKNLDEDIESLKGDQSIPLEQFVIPFKQKMLKRHDLVANIIKKLQKVETVDLINVSSATSTPINCKSLFSSVHNSSLKKRDYKQMKNGSAEKMSVGTPEKKERGSLKNTPEKERISERKEKLSETLSEKKEKTPSPQKK